MLTQLRLPTTTLIRNTCDSPAESHAAREDFERKATRWLCRIRKVVGMCRAWRSTLQGPVLTSGGSRRAQAMLAVLQSKADSLLTLLDRFACHPERLEPEHAQVFEERVESLVRCAIQLDRFAMRARRISFTRLQPAIQLLDEVTGSVQSPESVQRGQI